VVNVIGGKVSAKPEQTPSAGIDKQYVQQEQQRFQEMRARLLGQDQRD